MTGNIFKTGGTWSLAGGIGLGRAGFEYGGKYGAIIGVNVAIWSGQTWAIVPGFVGGYVVGSVTGGTFFGIIGSLGGSFFDNPDSGEAY